jgi:2'-5' RNA ligase
MAPGPGGPGDVTQTGLVIVIPEAEARVGAMRRKYDPQASLGVPAHVTILFPFVPPDLVDAEVRRRLRRLFRRCSPFACRLSVVARFPATAYIAPAVAAPFIELTEAVVAEFPQYPPYGGAHAGVIPHLTVADGDARAADDAELELRADFERNGPIISHCGSVRLLENSTGRWKTMDEFALVGHQG